MHEVRRDSVGRVLDGIANISVYFRKPCRRREMLSSMNVLRENEC